MFKTWKSLSLLAMLALVLVLAACGGSSDNEEGNSENQGEGSEESAQVGEGKEIELVYVEWDSELASTNVVGKVLEDLGYDVTITPIDNAVMWQSVASGEADGMVAAWLPATHGDLYEEHKDNLVDLGENLEGAKIGLVVPEYMDVESISDLENYADELDQKLLELSLVRVS